MAETVVGEQLGSGDDTSAAKAEQIKALRADIDRVDEQVIGLLAQRFHLTRQVGLAKAEAGFAPTDPFRESEQLERLQVLALQTGLDPQIAVLYHSFVAGEAKKRHSQIAQRAQEALRSII